MTPHNALPVRPADDALARRIEMLVPFVVVQGAALEAMVREKQAGNPEFDFLQHHGAGSAYYRALLRSAMLKAESVG